MIFTTTNRGFSYSEFKDRNGATCSIQKSSLATEDAIWLGVTDADPKVMAIDAKRLGVGTDAINGWVPYPVPKEVLMNTRMHLTVQQVRDLLPALICFAETGDLPGDA